MRKIERTLVLLFLFTIGLSGCFQKTIKELVDNKFPPVDASQYREKAISTSAASLEVMESPDVAAVLRLDDIRKTLEETDILKKANVKNVRIKGDNQLLLADVQIDGIFTSSMFPNMDVESASFLDYLKPNLVGVLKIGASITSAVAVASGTDLSLEFQLLPLFREIRIEELTVTEGVELAKSADFIAGIINNFADNISGELSRAKFAKLTVPASPVESFETSTDDSKTLDDGSKIDVSQTGQQVSSPVFVKAIAFKINSKDISVLVDLAPNGETVSTPAVSGPVQEFSIFEAIFDRRLGELVATSERPDATWAALSKSSLSHLINTSFQQANLCIDVEATVPRQEFSEKVDIPDENTVDCTATRNCTPTRDCSFSGIECKQTRDCSGGHIDCGGYEWYQAPDKIRCEVEKKAWKVDCERIKSQNKGFCEVNKKAKSIDCERLKSQEKGICEIEKTGEKLLCETGKEALKRLSRTGNIANVDGFAQAKGRLSICAHKVVFDPKLANLKMTLGIEGQADVRVGVKWVPLDILGHLMCPFQWSEHKDLKVTVPSQNFDVRSAVKYIPKEESFWITVEVDTSDLEVELRPNPRDLILKSYNMKLACPLIGGFLVNNASVVVVASEAVPELQGKFTFPGYKRKYEFEVEPIVFDIPNSKGQGKVFLKSTENALLIYGRHVQ
ncbi:MAG: hypothetical protein JKY81_09405 [Colwellia sp.]|nr:hypothetical protein [Colwellia sp.]